MIDRLQVYFWDRTDYELISAQFAHLMVNERFALIQARRARSALSTNFKYSFGLEIWTFFHKRKNFHLIHYKLGTQGSRRETQPRGPGALPVESCGPSGRYPVRPNYQRCWGFRLPNQQRSLRRTAARTNPLDGKALRKKVQSHRF